MIPSGLVIASSKGGVGKTTTAAQLGGLAALAGYRVLLIELDPQANLSRDLGFRDHADNDHGESLIQAMWRGGAPRRIRGIRPGLDVVPGGRLVRDWAAIAAGRHQQGDKDIDLALDRALAEVAGEYDLIVFDCPPGDVPLQRQAAAASRFMVIPTMVDAGSLDGLIGTAELFDDLATVNPYLELLGVVLFRVPERAVALRREARAEIEQAFGTADVLFDTVVRDSPRTAKDCRARGQLVVEYEEDAINQVPWYKQVAAGKGAHRLSATSTGLAADYEALVREILTRRSAALETSSVAS